MEIPEVFPFIVGENIDLVAMNLEHVNLYVKWNNDPRVRRYARNTTPFTVEESKKRLEPREGIKEFVSFEIYHKKDKVPIGTCGYGHIDWINRHANTFMSIGEPKYWNKNLGTEASKLLIDYGFGELNFHKIYAGIFEPNIGSWSVAEKDGFVLEGVEKKRMYVDGEYVDARLYRYLKEDWLKSKK